MGKNSALPFTKRPRTNPVLLFFWQTFLAMAGLCIGILIAAALTFVVASLAEGFRGPSNMSGASPYVRAYQFNQTPIDVTSGLIIVAIGLGASIYLFRRGRFYGFATGLSLSSLLLAFLFAVQYLH